MMLVTDRRRLSPAARTTHDELLALERLLDSAVEAGVDLIQIRERDLDAGAVTTLARSVAARARATRVLINDRIDIALAGGVHGVHLRADGIAATRARQLAPDGWLLGRSVHAPVDATRLGAGADYLLFGTVFPSVSKPEGPAAGLEALRAVVQAVTLPVMAIGGITPERAGACIGAGAAGVASIGAFLPEATGRDSLGVRRATDAFRAAMAVVPTPRRA